MERSTKCPIRKEALLRYDTQGSSIGERSDATRHQLTVQITKRTREPNTSAKKTTQWEVESQRKESFIRLDRSSSSVSIVVAPHLVVGTLY